MLKYFLDTSKLGHNKGPKILAIGFGLIITAIVLGFVLQFGFTEYPELVGFGFISFAIACVLTMVVMLISMIMMQLYLKKHHFSIWKESMSISAPVKAEAIRQIKMLDDSYLKKLSVNSTKIGVSFLLVWVVLLLVVACIVFISGENNFLKTLFEK
ncbi:MAG: hypothetical protein NTW55_00375 [Planctomycetota bacterium]|nr:hypothetical protein [Planctomycetota bacterium]